MSPNELYSLNDELTHQIAELETRLRRGQICGSVTIALLTLDIIKKLISGARYTTVKGMMRMLRELGVRLQKSVPTELVVGNIFRRVLFVIRDETNSGEGTANVDHHVAPLSPGATFSAQPSLSNLLEVLPSLLVTGAPVNQMKDGVLQALDEFEEEVRSADSMISKLAVDHIHNKEVIMTYGVSATVEQFLKSARKKQSFQLFLVEAGHVIETAIMARSLAAAGIEVTVVPSSACSALMTRVNKLVLGAQAVLANGAVLCHAGADTVAVVAKAHAVPLVVTTPLFKLTPIFPSPAASYNISCDPSPSLPLAQAERLGSDIQVLSPRFDLVPPERVELYITNDRSHAPSYVYRLLAEYYHPDDHDLLSEL